jgi:cyclic pyranopterin phosphate synthase
MNQTQMIDVGAKAVTQREAVARGEIWLRAETAKLVREAAVPKGNVLEVARVAAIMAAKRTPDLIPLCHPLLISHASCEFTFADDLDTLGPDAITCIEAKSRVRCAGQTGVEMEALAAVSAALLTIYDMTKGIDDTLRITDIVLLEKTGGKSGDYKRQD